MAISQIKIYEIFFLDAGRAQWFIIYFLLESQSAIISFFVSIFDAFEFELISILSLGCWLKVDWQMSLVVTIEGFLSWRQL